jgi:hypothetical protein
MRLQLLGDSRDAFKWDCLHWLVSESEALDQLVVVPMLCDDIPDSSEGQVPPDRFRSRPEIALFLTLLREEPRSFERIESLGCLEGLSHFNVLLYRRNRLLGYGWERATYWADLLEHPPSRTVVFLDPDTGFEAISESGKLHLRFGEALAICAAIGDQSVLAVYHHRGRGQTWAEVLGRLWRNMPPHLNARAIYGGDVALILLGSPALLAGLDDPIRRYLAVHPQLRLSVDGGV